MVEALTKSLQEQREEEKVNQQLRKKPEVLEKTPIEQQMDREGYHYSSSNQNETGHDFVQRRKSQLREEIRSKRRLS